MAFSLYDSFQQLHRTLLAGVVGTQFAAEGFGEDGFLHGIDLVDDGGGSIFGLLFIRQNTFQTMNNLCLLFYIRK